MQVSLWHIAQINVGRLVAPIDDPRIQPFVDRLDAVNAVADAAPGFVWRLQDDTGNATSILVTDDPFFLINMSVWTDIESFTDFVYGDAHKPLLSQRLDWFERPRGPILAMWWVPAGHIPTPDEGIARLDHLKAHGPGPHAFTLAKPFPPPTTDENAF